MGVEIETIQPGDSETYPKQGQTVVVHYTGTLTNGTKFDSSRDRGVPFKFRLGKGEVIKGWDQGIAQMCVGQRARLKCSPDFAYGSRGHPGMIHLKLPKSTQKVRLVREDFLHYIGVLVGKTISVYPGVGTAGNRVDTDPIMYKQYKF